MLTLEPFDFIQMIFGFGILIGFEFTRIFSSFIRAIHGEGFNLINFMKHNHLIIITFGEDCWKFMLCIFQIIEPLN